jgi:hypothetical protein
MQIGLKNTYKAIMIQQEISWELHDKLHEMDLSSMYTTEWYGNEGDENDFKRIHHMAYESLLTLLFRDAKAFIHDNLRESLIFVE